jgi:hypothetical protein
MLHNVSLVWADGCLKSTLQNPIVKLAELARVLVETSKIIVDTKYPVLQFCWRIHKGTPPPQARCHTWNS